VKLALRITGGVLVGLGLLQLIFWEPSDLFARHAELRWIQDFANWMRWPLALAYIWGGVRLLRNPMFMFRRAPSYHRTESSSP
jgi:hypothetical protein